MQPLALQDWQDVKAQWRLTEPAPAPAVAKGAAPPADDAAPSMDDWQPCALAGPNTTVAVLANEVRLSRLRGLFSRFPRLREVLILAPEAAFELDLPADERKAPDVREGLAKCRFAVMECIPNRYPVEAYITIVDFLLRSKEPLRHVAFGHMPFSFGYGPDRPLHAVLKDMHYDYSELFLKVADLPQAKPNPVLLWNWVEYLFGDRPFHALKLLYGFRKLWPNRMVQSKVMNAWMQLRQAEVLLPIMEAELGDTPQYADVRQELEKETMLAAKTRAETFRANVEYLQERSGAALAAMEATAPDTTIRAVHEGSSTLLFRVHPERIEQLTFAPSYEEVIFQFQKPESQRLPYQLFVGSGKGLNALRVKNILDPDIEVPNWVPSFYLVEPNAQLFRAILEHFPIRDSIGVAQLVCFAGPAWEQQMVAYFALDQSHVPPPAQYLMPPELLDAIGRWLTEYRRITTDLKSEVDAYYASLPHEAILRAFENRPDRPLRVLIPTSVHSTVLQHVADDLAAGFAELGCTARTLKEKDPLGTMRMDRTLQTLAEFKPDLVVLLDHLRSDSLSGCAKTGLPVASWIQDRLPYPFTRAAAEELGPLDFTYVLKDAWKRSLQVIGYGDVKILQFAVNQRLYCPAPGASPRNEAALLSRLGSPPSKHSEPLIREMNEVLCSATDLQQETTRFEERHHADFATLSDRVRNQMILDMSDCMRFHIRTRVARQLLEAGIPLAIWGRGWENLPEFAPFWKGEVQPGPDLCRLYQSYKVIVHPALLLHPRFLEALSSGSLVVVDGFNANILPDEMGDFQAGTDVVFARTHDELIAAIKRGLVDDEWRTHMIAAGSEKVRSTHSYAARAQSICHDIREALCRPAPAATAPTPVPSVIDAHLGAIYRDPWQAARTYYTLRNQGDLESAMRIIDYALPLAERDPGLRENLRRLQCLNPIVARILALKAQPATPASEPTLICSLSAWGNSYIDLFVNYALPSLLHPSNLPSVLSRRRVIVKIFTDAAGAARLEQEAGVQSLMRLANVQIEPMPAEVFQGHPYALFSMLHYIAIHEAIVCQADWMPLYCDVLCPIDAVGHLLNWIEDDGFDAVANQSLGIDLNLAAELILRKKRDGVIGISARELADLLFHCMSPHSQSCRVDLETSEIPTDPSAVWFASATGLYHHVLQPHADYVSARSFRPVPSFNYASADNGLLTCLFSARESFRRIKYVTDSSDYGALALETHDPRKINRRVQVADVASALRDLAAARSLLTLDRCHAFRQQVRFVGNSPPPWAGKVRTPDTDIARILEHVTQFQKS